MEPQLHFTGPIWRPPYEAGSQLLQVTAGCTWHRCKFCSLYHGTPFRMSPLNEVEEDLRVIRQWQPRARRVYLTGANPFVMSYDKLMDIALLLRKYLPKLESFGMFARVTDIASKSVEELKNLRHMRLSRIPIIPRGIGGNLQGGTGIGAAYGNAGVYRPFDDTNPYSCQPRFQSYAPDRPFTHR